MESPRAEYKVMKNKKERRSSVLSPRALVFPGSPLPEQREGNELQAHVAARSPLRCPLPVQQWGLSLGFNHEPSIVKRCSLFEGSGVTILQKNQFLWD